MTKAKLSLHDLFVFADREKAIPQIQLEVQALLQEVGLINASIKIEHTVMPAEELNETGIDKIAFLFSPNKGSQFLPLNKVASGGELSRLMLCFKSILARSTRMPTIIFDEIDTGISGEVALKVGSIIRNLARHHQVIAITHLPQMAGKGKNHLFVYKEVAGNSTITSIKKLEEKERIIEIAKMLSGNNPTETAMANAKELMG